MWPNNSYDAMVLRVGPLTKVKYQVLRKPFLRAEEAFQMIGEMSKQSRLKFSRLQLSTDTDI